MSSSGLTRRALLRSLPGALIVVSCGGGSGDGDSDSEGSPEVPGVSDPEEVLRVFPQGLASGDPRPASVLLWTRAQPNVGEESGPIELRLRVSARGCVDGAGREHTSSVVVGSLLSWWGFDLKVVLNSVAVASVGALNVLRVTLSHPPAPARLS